MTPPETLKETCRKMSSVVSPSLTVNIAMPVFVQVCPAIVILTLSEAEGEESLYFARSTVDTTGKYREPFAPLRMTTILPTTASRKML
jgi:hypothetical protein